MQSADTATYDEPTYFSFDDDALRGAASADPIGFIAALDVLPRLMEFGAGQTARLVNVTELAAPFTLTRQTIDGYVTLLRHVFLLDLLPAWHSNRLKRLVKAPKLHIGDTGLAMAVLGLDADGLRADRPLYGQLLESFVYHELRRQASGRSDGVRFHHYRDRDGYEVDIVLERDGRHIAGIEVKACGVAIHIRQSPTQQTLGVFNSTRNRRSLD